MAACDGAGVSCKHSELMDEAQVEAHKSLVKFKVFRYTDEESEAKAKEAVEKFKEEQEATTGRIWSDISHGKDNYYVALSPVGEMAVESVREAGEYYKLNVPLTAGYIVGRNWAETH